MDWLISIAASGCGVAIVTGVFKLLEMKIGAKIKDRPEKNGKKPFSADTLCLALRVILHDRIKYLARVHITEGTVSFEDRRDIFEMHSIYHDGLQGNGNLSALMDAFSKLPIK
ncbi:MAG: hypothetical protein FWE82_09110 [Defluviitaleaceae bacterium]|nr:hypothetical protein [Defluviitaleaceae bacterium]